MRPPVSTHGWPQALQMPPIHPLDPRTSPRTYVYILGEHRLCWDPQMSQEPWMSSGSMCISLGATAASGTHGCPQDLWMSLGPMDVLGIHMYIPGVHNMPPGATHAIPGPVCISLGPMDASGTHGCPQDLWISSGLICITLGPTDATGTHRYPPGPMSIPQDPHVHPWNPRMSPRPNICPQNLQTLPGPPRNPPVSPFQQFSFGSPHRDPQKRGRTPRGLGAGPAAARPGRWRREEEEEEAAQGGKRWRGPPPGESPPRNVPGRRVHIPAGWGERWERMFPPLDLLC